jgi:flagellar biosynthesis GTPase FlhF
MLICDTSEIVSEKSVALKLDNLKAKMKSILREDQHCELSKPLSPADYFDANLRVNYLQEWERVIRVCLEKELDAVILRSEEWNKGFNGIPVDQLEEIIHHCSTAFEKARHFFGREELLQSALEKMKTSKQPFSGIILALVGKSGCGKTALMSKLALSCTGSSEPTIIRFCGTSKFILNGLKLIQSISLQILAIYEKNDELKQLIDILPSRIINQRCIISRR